MVKVGLTSEARSPIYYSDSNPLFRCILRKKYRPAVVTVMDREPAAAGRPGQRAGPARERLFTTMNASARIETEAEVGRGDHFSHDGSERLVMKDEETAAEPMGGIEQPLLTPLRRRTFTLTPLPPRRPSPDAAALRTEPTTTPFDQNVTSLLIKT